MQIDWSDPFWSKVHPEALSGCWLWHGGLTRASGAARYGLFRGDRAHRVAYRMTRGPVGDHTMVRQVCGVPACVNPDHLVTGAAGRVDREWIAKNLWRSVARRGPAECWLFQGRSLRDGYGVVYFSDKEILAHRAAYTVTHGEIPEGAYVLHACDMRACCNPEHLHLGTHADNMREMAERGRAGRLKGSRNPIAKLTEERVRHIKRRLADGVPAAEIARAEGVVPGAVYNIRSGLAWRHVS